MKKIIFALMMIFCAGASVSAQEITKEEFAGLISPIAGGDVLITEMENPSESISEFEAIKSLVAVWEIRMGNLEPAALGGYLEGYSSLAEEEKKIADKAVMLGIAPKSGKISKSDFLIKETSEEYINQIKRSIDIMKNHGVAEIITSFRNELGVTGTPNGRITFYASLNKKPQFDNAVVVLALYSSNRLINVSKNSYSHLENNDFTVMHASVNVPEEGENLKAKAFIFDSLNTLIPVCEYKLIR